MVLQKKSLSPRELAAYSGIVLSVPIAAAFFFLQKDWKTAVIALPLVFIAVYTVILFVIERFIYRKVKLIYKIINRTKATKKEEMYYKYLLPQKSIDEVRDDVEAWAEQQAGEIELLKKNEVFRKEFLQNLSHEFKTPVFSIQGYVDILLQGGIENPDINRKYLQKAANNVERLVNLIKDLDEISKLERGEIKLLKQYFVIQDLLRQVFDSLSLKMDQKNISFTIKKGCEKPITVFADKEKIRQVLTNLADNSIKYGRTGGTVVASVYNTDDKNVLVEISDDGMGIPEKQLSRVFERFYRTSEGRAREVAGTGLGLAICKHIIEAHGHTIHVRSKEGVGTTFGFTLDTKKPEKEPRPVEN